MCRSERVVDVKIAERRQLAREGGIVCFLLAVEANVLEQDEITVGERRRGFARGLADAIGGECDRESEARAELARYRGERIFRARRTVRAAEVREHDRARALLVQVAQRRERRHEPRLVGDGAVLHRDVEIFADDDALAADVEILEREEVHLREYSVNLSRGIVGRTATRVCDERRSSSPPDLQGARTRQRVNRVSRGRAAPRRRGGTNSPTRCRTMRRSGSDRRSRR